MWEKGDTIQIGPWTYKVCRVEQQTAEEVLLYAVPIEKEGE